MKSKGGWRQAMSECVGGKWLSLAEIVTQGLPLKANTGEKM